jgi:hypothetical protein
MTARITYPAVALALLLVAPIPSARAVGGQSSAQVSGQTGGGAGAIEPEAIAALDRMGTFLRSLRAFQVQAGISIDDVLDDGQTIQLDSVANLVAQRPDRLRLELTSDRQQRLFFYDGKTFALWAPRTSYYATVPAPPSILELADQLEAKYAIELPLVDLFRWGGPRSDSAAITVAKDIGPSEVGGTTCEQYAFRQQGLDWQIWIQRGDYPLPRKVVLTTTTDEARPQYSAVYTWNLAPSFDAGAFTFAPPRDAHRIPIEEAGPDRASPNR